MAMEAERQAIEARSEGRKLRLLSNSSRGDILNKMADFLQLRKDEILNANATDCKVSK